MEPSQQIVASRNGHYAENIVFVDGLWGCGKTMLSPIIAAMDRAELLSYSYEIEHLCALHYLGKMTLDRASSLIRMYTDLKLYNQMMGRDVNFRPTDLSSATNDSNPSRYFQRLFEKDDEVIPEKIKNERPILNLATHNLIPFAAPIFDDLEKRAKFIEVVRHPLFMVKQQALNFDHLINDARDFTVYYTYQGNKFPYYARGWEEEYLECNSIEKAILYQYHLTKLSKEAYAKASNVLVIPFEKFVIAPDGYMKDIEKMLSSTVTEQTKAMMKKQKVPRENIISGIDLEIYRRCR